MAEIIENIATKEGENTVYQRKELELGFFKGVEFLLITKLPDGREELISISIFKDDRRIWQSGFKAYSTDDMDLAYTIIKNAKQLANQNIDPIVTTPVD